MKIKKGDATGAVFRKTALSVFFWFGTPVRRSKRIPRADAGTDKSPGVSGHIRSKGL